MSQEKGELERKLQRLVNQSEQVSDEAIRKDLQRQIDGLRIQIEGQDNTGFHKRDFQPKGPVYFSSKVSRFDEVYELRDLITISATRQLVIGDDKNAPVNDMIELFRKKAIEIALQGGYDAVFCNDGDVYNSFTRELHDESKGGIYHTVRTIDELPGRKVRVEQNMRGTGEFYVRKNK